MFARLTARRVSMVGAAIAFVWLSSSLAPTAAREAEKPVCTIAVSGKTYGIDDCRVRRDPASPSAAEPLSVTLGPSNLRRVRYFAYLSINADNPGTADAFWNETEGASHAHTPLGKLNKVGSCWESETAKICLPGSSTGTIERTANAHGCPTNIDKATCDRSLDLLRQHVVGLTSGNISSELVNRLRQRTEYPLRNTPCFFAVNEKLQASITKCILPRRITAPSPDQPIILRASPFDACNQNGEVIGLDPRGDNYLAVKAGPSGNHREKDRLGQGGQVWICAQEGQWLAVVYPTQGEECGVNTPAPRTSVYQGACAWGWVHQRYIKVTAG